MSASGLDVFDRTLETTHIWLNEICNDLGPDKQVAWKVLSTVLHKLRDRLTINLAAHLGAQLPLLIRGVYYDQFEPRTDAERVSQPRRFRRRSRRMAQRHAAGRSRGSDPLGFPGALAPHFARARSTRCASALPKSLRRLWEEAEDPTVFAEEP